MRSPARRPRGLRCRAPLAARRARRAAHRGLARRRCRRRLHQRDRPRRCARAAPGRVVRRIPALRIAEVRPAASPGALAAAVACRPGIRVRRAARPARLDRHGARRRPRRSSGSSLPRAPRRCPSGAARRGAITIAVVDTGADVSAPDLAAKAPRPTASSTARRAGDMNGHGTFVASLAAGSRRRGRHRRLRRRRAAPRRQGGRRRGSVQRHGRGERDRVRRRPRREDRQPQHRRRRHLAHRAARDRLRRGRGVLLVAAAGNEFGSGNPVEYPAALVQPVGSNGQGGAGLVRRRARTSQGRRADFSNTGSHVSLAAPGVNVLGAVASTSSPSSYPRVPLPGSTRRASTATAAARRSPPRRSRAPRRSSGPRTRR